MMNEIVYTQSSSYESRGFLIDMTLLVHQKSGGTCAVISEVHTELHATTRNRGVDVSRVLFSCPDSTQQAREILESLVRSGTCSMIVVEHFGKLMTPAFEATITDLAKQTSTSILLAR